MIKMDLELDNYLKHSGIKSISKVKSTLEITTNDKIYRIKFKDGQTQEDTAKFLETELDEPLGRKLSQYIIVFICKPENYCKIEISKYEPKYHYDNFEQWQIAVESAYHKLHKTVDDNLPQAWSAIEFILSIKAILHIKEITLPYIGIILGPPAGVKTVPLRLLKGRKHTFFTDRFNPHAMVSHVSTLPRGMKEGNQHMLNKMKNCFVIAPELASLLSGREDEVRENIQLMTRVADGEGLETDSGLGHKGVTGKVQFVMGGAFVEFSPMIYGMLTTFGAKLYFFRLPKIKKTHKQYLDDLKGETFTIKFQRMKDAMDEYLDIFESCPSAELEDNLQKISLDKFRSNESEDALDIIVHLGMLLGRLRLVTWTKEYSTNRKKTTQEGDKTETIESEERDFSFNTSLLEDPSRANQQHYNLALAHALSIGRTSIGIEDIPLVVRVTLSTAPQNRHRVFEELLDNGGTITTKDIEDALHIHRNTAGRTMTPIAAW